MNGINLILINGSQLVIQNNRRDISYNASNGVRLRADAAPEIRPPYLFLQGSDALYNDTPVPITDWDFIRKCYFAVAEYNVGVSSTIILQGQVPCKKCGQFHEWNTLNNKGYCQPCADLIKECDYCGGEDAYISFNGKIYCKTCGILKERDCNNCGTHTNTMRKEVNIPSDYHGSQKNVYLCETCYPLPLIYGMEHSYQYKPDELNFWSLDKKGKRVKQSIAPSKTLYMGIEFECMFPHWTQENLQIAKILSTYGEKENMLFAKHDGSIPNPGSEIVTHPMTLEFIKSLSWEGLTKNIIKPDTKGVGGHIHCSKTAFWSLAHIYRFVKFMRTNIKYCEWVGERPLQKDYCSGKTTRKTSTYALRNLTNSDRYEMVNFTEHTIELRFPWSPYTPEMIYKNTEFVHALWAYTINAPLHFTIEDFERFVRTQGKLYKNLINFIDSRTSNIFRSNDEFHQPNDEDEEYLCASCGRYHNNTTWINGQNYCTGCYFCCDFCDDYHPNTNLRTLGYSDICPSCFESNTICSSCEDVVEISDITEGLCISCYNARDEDEVEEEEEEEPCSCGNCH